MNKWFKYVDETRNKRRRNNRQTSNEPYQQAVKKGYVKDRNQYLKGGPVSTSAGGSGYTEKPPDDRALSAPPIGEEVERDSFDMHDTLETRIWNDMVMDSKVRSALLRVAHDFIENLPVKVKL